VSLTITSRTRAAAAYRIAWAVKSGAVTSVREIAALPPTSDIPITPGTTASNLPQPPAGSIREATPADPAGLGSTEVVTGTEGTVGADEVVTGSSLAG
jgi:hypothetical protein